MSGKRKVLMFFGQLIVAAILNSIGKLSGAEFVSLQIMAFPTVILGNFGEYAMKKGAASNAAVPSV